MFAIADEMWSHVGRKSQQNWLWYVIERAIGRVLAFVFERRTDEVARQLAALLPAEVIDVLFTDDWEVYISTGRICPNSCCRQGAYLAHREKKYGFTDTNKETCRHTICSSKSFVVHKAVIGLFINKYLF